MASAAGARAYSAGTKVAKATAKRVAARSTVKAVGAGVGKAAAGAGAMGPFMAKLLSLAGKHPMMAGIGGMVLLQMLMSRVGQHADTGAIPFVSNQPDLERQAIEQQMGQSPDDMYYQAMAGSLGQERQQAQNALLQAIMSGRGQAPLARGERAVGGGGQGGGYYGGF